MEGGELSRSKGELWKHPDRYVALLNAESKQVRRKTLDVILAETKTLPYTWLKDSSSIASKVDSDDDEEDDAPLPSTTKADAGGDISQEVENLQIQPTSCPASIEDVKAVIKPLLQCLFDQVEKCREVSYETLTLLFERVPKSVVTEFMPRTVSILLERLGQQELIESSEEVRLLALRFMHTIMIRMDKELSPFVDDWIRILSVTLVDPYHEVRKSTCELTCKSARAMPHVFHYNSERLIKPLCVSITHQQSKVRVAVVHCIGDVLLFGSHKGIEDFIPHLTQRLFDPQPNVRKAVVDVVGSWMMDYVDRYSYFHKLLPLIITGLCDESPNVSELAYKLWEKVGEKYLEENVEEYKDQVDFPIEMPSHYPEEVKRPNFGCRLLTQRNACKIIPGVGNDITDWVETTRVKCAQLLFHLILNCEEKITMHSEPILHCMFRSSTDLSSIVVKYVLKSAKLLGYFVPLSTTWPILSSSLSTSPSEGCLSVTASLIEGVQPDLLQEFTLQILKLISSSDVCQTLKTVRQYWILQCCEAFMKLVPSTLVADELGTELTQLTFRTLISVLAMAQDGETQVKAMVGLQKLSEINRFKSTDELFTLHARPLLLEIKENPVIWASSTPEKLIFAAILTHAGSGMEAHMELISEILASQVQPDKDAEVRLKLFTLLGEILGRYSQALSQSNGQSTDVHPVVATPPRHIQIFVHTIVQDVLSPSLTWKAGKTASALRAAASSCLLTILDESLLASELVAKIHTEVITGCIGLLDDNYHINRLIGVQCLGRVVYALEGKCAPDVLHKIYPELLKRLDDEKNEVRVSSIIAIQRLFTNLPSDYNVDFFKAHVDYLMNVLLVHLDDEEEEMQDLVYDALQTVGAILPDMIIEKSTSFRTKHRSPFYCDKLIEYFKSLQ